MASKIYEKFGDRLAAARSAAGLTQGQVAAAAGLSRSSLANIEAGRQKVFLHQIFDIARALKMGSISDLLPGDISPVLSSDHDIGDAVNFTGSTLNEQERTNLSRLVKFLEAEVQ